MVLFIRTTPSIFGKLRESCKKKAPKEIVNTITKGIEKLNAVEDIPRNSKQVYNTSSISPDNDALLSVMIMWQRDSRE